MFQTRCLLKALPKSTITRTISYEIIENCAKITLTNNKKRNVLTHQTINDIRTTLELSKKNEKVKTVLITADESKVFSAGHDLKELIDEQKSNNVIDDCVKMMLEIQYHPLPVICEVVGICAAAGTQLLSTSDIAIGSSSSTYSVPGINVGLFCLTPSVPLSRRIQMKSLSKYLFTGRSMSAEEAYKCGLLSEIVRVDKEEQIFHETRKRTLEIIGDISKKSRRVLIHAKSSLNRHISAPTIEEAYEHAKKGMKENLMFEETVEGINSFKKKKPIIFK
ncbi:hypothetical protein SNEBB_009438 [Seison nebaliae]|nr:hypothetical protein SNEBB_009438 [Seison nebaliae]